MKLVTCAVSFGVLGGAAQPLFAGTTLYDSRGFESPTFTIGNLDNQDASRWIESGGANAGTAAVENSSAYSGTQAVIVTRSDSSQNGGDKRYWPNQSAFTPTAANPFVSVSWDMKVPKNTTAGVSTGPFYGIEAYDPNVNLIAGAGVDATTGEILFTDPAFGGGFNNTTADATVTLGAWNHFSLAMNFTTQTAYVFVNGNLQQTITGFDSTGVTKFSDADLSAIATAIEPINQTGTALFDNYLVVNTNQVPEPTKLSVTALTAVAALKRRDRKGGR